MQGNSIDLFGHPIKPGKYCPDCKRTLPFEDFYLGAGGKGHRSYRERFCKKCRCKRTWAQAKKNPNRPTTKKRDALKRWFGMTLEQYEAMHAAQNGLCAICHKKERVKDRTGAIQRLSVDHNHATGLVRKLLCGQCNRGIGMFCEDPELLISAAAYLKSFS
jgi:hypothetical protein